MKTSAAREISLTGSSKTTIMLFHGYTGSPHDFDSLPEKLNREFGASVRIIELLGHETGVEDLLRYSYADYRRQVEEAMEEALRDSSEIIVGGFSFGGLLAAHIATKYETKGLLIICAPIWLRSPFNIPLLASVLCKVRPIWKKRFSEKQQWDLGFTFFYDRMPSLGLKFCQEGSREVRSSLSGITCPIMQISAEKDRVVNKRKCRNIKRRTNAPYVANCVYPNAGHRLLSKDILEMIRRDIAAFLRTVGPDAQMGRERVAAVVPAYNEEKLVGGVLSQLQKIPFLDEILVVDDGSTDNTARIVGRYQGVRLLRNEKNMGKARSMDIGVRNTTCDVIFFCDADIVGMDPNEVARIITPVLRGEVDMCLGLRKNKMQRAVKLFTLNTGERALRRELWESVPDFFKHRYRIEAGLNYYAKHYGKGFTYRQMSYFQTLKEKKYGFLRGTYLRWRMNLDVLSAYMMAYMIDLPRKTLAKMFRGADWGRRG